MRARFSAAGTLLVLAAATATPTPVTVSPWTATWNQGSEDCRAHPQPPLEVHAYNARTFALRESLCSTWEAPFMYLLLGDTKALLIDTGDVADAKQMPLAQTVLQLVSQHGSPDLPLLVVHTHRHLDHRSADPQFAHLPDVRVVGYDLASVRQFFGFTHWPEGRASVDLGNRIVDVLPAPGHEGTHLVFYDRNTTLLFSGDFMMPGRLLIDDSAADLLSARRVAEFVSDKPVSAVLGGHIEEDADGRLFPWQSTFHPRERRLELGKSDLLAFPAELQGFNGFYSRSGKVVMLNPIRNLIAMAAAALIALVALTTGAIYFFRRRKRRRANARLGVA
jgi:glyoxylase-like metal-dependent hydrolase (beta-lactamase superfamily II)